MCFLGYETLRFLTVIFAFLLAVSSDLMQIHIHNHHIFIPFSDLQYY